MPQRAVLACVIIGFAAVDARSQSTSGVGTGRDRLSVFGQVISAAVDRAADLVVFATLCGVGREVAGGTLRDAAVDRIAACFKTDSKAATWAADARTQFDGKRALLLDIARMRSKDAVCGRLFEGDGKTLSAFGREVVADGERFSAPGVTPVAATPCP